MTVMIKLKAYQENEYIYREVLVPVGQTLIAASAEHQKVPSVDVTVLVGGHSFAHATIKKSMEEVMGLLQLANLKGPDTIIDFVAFCWTDKDEAEERKLRVERMSNIVSIRQ